MRSVNWVMVNAAERRLGPSARSPWCSRPEPTRSSSYAKHCACFEPNDQPAPIGQEGKGLEDPDDLRVLAQVLGAQKTVLQRKRAIEILESLADKNLAKPEDRFLLAAAL